MIFSKNVYTLCVQLQNMNRIQCEFTACANGRRGIKPNELTEQRTEAEKRNNMQIYESKAIILCYVAKQITNIIR